MNLGNEKSTYIQGILKHMDVKFGFIDNEFLEEHIELILDCQEDVVRTVQDLKFDIIFKIME